MQRSQLYTMTLLTAAFLSGYFIRDIGYEKPSSSILKEKDSQKLMAKSQSPESIPTKKVVTLATPPKISTVPQFVPKLVVPETIQVVNNTETQQDTYTLLALMENRAGQQATFEKIRDSNEYQLLISKLQADPTARIEVLDRFLKSSGTPLGKTLSLALTSSGISSEMPELKAATEQLLRTGSAEQRLDALQILGESAISDPQTRATVLEVLRKDSLANPQLAASALSALDRRGISSQVEHQAVVNTVLPFTQNEDPWVRQSSLEVLAQWASHDPNTLQAFTKATQDSDLGVRSAAVSALGRGGFAYEQVRDPLLAAFQNPNEDISVRAAAQQALENYPLDDEALKIYQGQISSSGSQAIFN